MRAAFSYFGGKSRLAPWIASLLPPHRTYVEPFAGSAAVLFAKRPSKTEILNDLDGNVVNYFRVLREQAPALVRALTYTPYARDEYDAADLDEPGLSDVERARRFFVRVLGSMSHSTRATGFAIAAQSRPGFGGADHAHKFVSVVDRLDACAQRLRPVIIERKPAVQVITRFGADPHAALYVDPPYLADVRSLKTKRRGGDYATEYHSDDEHRALAESLRSARAAVVLSGYASPLYEELYSGWDRIERDVDVSLSHGTARPLKRATEVIWSNRPLVEQTSLQFGEVLA
jgi:DNA adenine methylase